MRQAAVLLFVLLACLSLEVSMALLGGARDIGNSQNSLEVEELAKFAVSEYNSNRNDAEHLSFSKVLSAKTQVVAGTLYHLTIEAHQGQEARHWDARVWVKPWEKFKKLEEFKPAAGAGGGHQAEL